MSLYWFLAQNGSNFYQKCPKNGNLAKNVSISSKNTVWTHKKAIKVFHNNDDFLENSKVHIGSRNWAFRVPEGTLGKLAPKLTENPFFRQFSEKPPIIIWDYKTSDG